MLSYQDKIIPKVVKHFKELQNIQTLLRSGTPLFQSIRLKEVFPKQIQSYDSLYKETICVSSYIYEQYNYKSNCPSL